MDFDILSDRLLVSDKKNMYFNSAIRMFSGCTVSASRGGSRDFPSPFSSSSTTKFVVISSVAIPEDGSRERPTTKHTVEDTNSSPVLFHFVVRHLFQL